MSLPKYGRELAILGLGLVVLSFIAGSVITEFKYFPYPQVLEDAYQQIRAGSQQRTLDHSDEPQGTSLWEWSRTKETGLLTLDQQRMWGDYTFFTSGHGPYAFLLNSEGQIVHEWNLPFREAWEEIPSHIDNLPTKHFIYWRKAHLFPNGDIIAVYAGYGPTPWGLGVVKLDKDSNVLWRYEDHTHHDLDFDDAGNIYGLVHEIRHEPIPNNPQLPSQVLDDFLIKLSPEGEELSRVSVIDAMVDSKFGPALSMFPNPQTATDKDRAWDVLHTNTVDLIRPSFARHHSFAEAGQVMLSFRSLDMVVLLDPEQRKLVWGTRGFWTDQHDPDPLDNGNILVFDNEGHVGPGGGSRIIEFNPATNEIEWDYSGTEEQPFYSAIRGVQQLLPNGNILVTESDGGRIFEVTREGEIVWDYSSPFRMEHPSGREVVAVTMSAKRLSVNEVDFPFNRPDASL